MIIDLQFDLRTHGLKLVQTTTIKPGGSIPVRVTFSEAPSDTPGIQLALASDSSSPELLAFLDVNGFEAESETVWLGTLDATDARLVAFMAGKSTTTVNAELTVEIDGETMISPNVAVTVQQRLWSGDPTTEGGPTYLTAAQVLAAYVPRTVAGKYRVKEDGSFQLWNGTQGKFHSLTITGGVNAEQLSFLPGEV